MKCQQIRRNIAVQLYQVQIAQMQRTAQFRDGIFRIGNEIAADARAGQQAVDQSDILLAARDV